MSILPSGVGDDDAREEARQTSIRIDTNVFAELSGVEEPPATAPKICRWLDCWQG